MERLTYRGERDWEIKGADGSPCDEVCENRFLSGCHDCPIQTAFDRLAAYEDTGLGPEEITTELYGCVFYCNRKCNLDGDFCAEGPGCPYEIGAEAAKHLLEIAQAEKDGRLVVLPCNVGDMLYEVDLPEYGVITCKVMHIGTYNGFMNYDHRNPMMFSVSVGVEVIEGYGKESGYAFEAEDFGKTVFLTREEAEAALKKRKDAAK